jgi:predicted Zn-dependent protease
MNNRHFLFFFMIPTIVIGAIFFGCVRNPATRKVHARLLSYESERKIGEESKNQILEQYSVLESTTVSKYVDSIGQKLAHVCDRPTVDYEFVILDSDLINAFAVPGGFIFVTRGLLESVEDEAELAMVIGHEIAHVTAMHGVQMIQKSMGANALNILGTIGAAITVGPEAMLMVNQTANLFSGLYLLGYTREKELEADNLGLQYMLRADYDPQASLRFLKQLEREDEDKIRGWDLYFRTHPTTIERINIIESMVGREETENAKTNKQEYQRIKQHLPQVDIRERGVIAGREYTNDIFHLKLRVPSNWTLGYYHPQSLVAFQTGNFKGEGRLQVVNVASATITAAQLAHMYAKRASFQFMNGREVLYQAGYGYLGNYVGVSARGEPKNVRLYSTIRRGKGFMLICMAPYENAESYFLDIENILRTFQFT